MQQIRNHLLLSSLSAFCWGTFANFSHQHTVRCTYDCLLSRIRVIKHTLGFEGKNQYHQNYWCLPSVWLRIWRMRADLLTKTLDVLLFGRFVQAICGWTIPISRPSTEAESNHLEAERECNKNPIESCGNGTEWDPLNGGEFATPAFWRMTLIGDSYLLQHSPIYVKMLLQSTPAAF